jgi:hypothetical protein
MARTLSDQDLIDRLEQIVKDGSNAAATIAAIKMLKDWDAIGKWPDDEMATLYEMTPRRKVHRRR